MSKLLTLSILSLGFALATASLPVGAVVKQTPAAGACKSALPVFDGLIRTRPLAVQNEGTSPAFITCAQQGDSNESVRTVLVTVDNQNAVATTVNCTLVVGFANPVYITVAASVSANSSDLLGFPPPVAGSPFPGMSFAYSCNLPPGTGITRVSFFYD